MNVTGSGVVSGNLTVQGNLTAQQIIVSSSVTYLTESFASGSMNFGNTMDDSHRFTGSVFITGALQIPTYAINPVGTYAQYTGAIYYNTIDTNIYRYNG